MLLGLCDDDCKQVRAQVLHKSCSEERSLGGVSDTTEPLVKRLPNCESYDTKLVE